MSTTTSSAAVEREAEHERAELVSTLGRLRENLRPGNMVDEVMASAKVSVSDVSDRIWRTARDNPIPAVMIGLGAAMLMGVGQKVRSKQALKEHEWTDRTLFPDDETSSSLQNGGRASGRSRLQIVSDRAAAAKDRLSTRLDAVSQQASQAASKIADSASDLRRQASQSTISYATSAREGLNAISGDAVMSQYSRSRDQVGHTITKLLDEQPLVLAALGIAVGAAIGAAIPSSEAEGQWMGDASESVKQTARDLAREHYETLKETAGQTLDDVKKSAAEHGLSTDNLSDLVEDVGSNVRSAAYQVGSHVAEQSPIRN